MHALDLRLEIHEDIERLGPESWPAASTPPSFYLGFRWLRSLHRALGSASYYVVVRRRDGRIAAALPCCLVADPVTYDYYNPARLLLDARYVETLARSLPEADAEQLRRLGARLVRDEALPYPALLATSPYGYVCGYAAPILADGEREAVAASLLAGFDSLANRLAAPTRAFWYAGGETCPHLVAGLSGRGYVETLLGATCGLAVRWQTFEGYLASLGWKRRGAVRREIRLFRELGLRVHVTGADDLSPEMADLQTRHERRYGHDSEAAQVLSEIDEARRNLGDLMRVFVATDGASTRGFVIAYEQDGVLYCKQGGFDRADGASSGFVYFNTAFYAPIKYAVGHGIGRLEYGMGSYAAKRARGCEMVDLAGYVRSEREPTPQLRTYLELYGRANREYLAHVAAGSCPAP